MKLFLSIIIQTSILVVLFFYRPNKHKYGEFFFEPLFQKLVVIFSILSVLFDPAYILHLLFSGEEKLLISFVALLLVVIQKILIFRVIIFPFHPKCPPIAGGKNEYRWKIERASSLPNKIVLNKKFILDLVFTPLANNLSLPINNIRILLVDEDLYGIESSKYFPLTYKSHSEDFFINQIYPTQLTPYEYEARNSYFEKVVINKDQLVSQEFCIIPKKQGRQMLKILFFDDNHESRLCGSYEEILQVYNSIFGIPINRVFWSFYVSLYYIV
ncbi:MAG: hypothetical protein ACRQFF_09550, partial [Sphaerochaeta sp.]